MELTLYRDIEHANTLLGHLVLNGRPVFSLEDKWRNNAREISCIPDGRYLCRPHGWGGQKVRFTRTWEITGVRGRTAILFHPGNKHFDTKGCVLVGFGQVSMLPDSELRDSQAAMNFMREVIGENSFYVNIISRYNKP